jgi:hypothetical protein
MSALMFTTAVLIFLMGLVSEQITQLIYRPVQTTDVTVGKVPTSRTAVRRIGT